MAGDNRDLVRFVELSGEFMLNGSMIGGDVKRAMDSTTKSMEAVAMTSKMFDNLTEWKPEEFDKVVVAMRKAATYYETAGARYRRVVGILEEMNQLMAGFQEQARKEKESGHGQEHQ
jgi:hypothetical protein